MSAEPLAQSPIADGGWHGNAETFLALIARGRNSLGRTLAGCALIVAAWIGLGIPLYYLLGTQDAAGSLRDFVVANLGVLVMLAGLVLAVAWVQQRPLLTLVTPRPRFDWRRAWQGFTACFAISGLAFAVECLLYPGRYALNPEMGRALAFVPAVLLLTPLQAATEELVFRGYLMQSMRTFTRSPLVIVAVSSLLFMLPHLWNPEAQHGVLIVLLYVLIAVFLAAVTLRDGRMELAIGAHAAINVFIALVASYPESVLETPALFMADVLDPAYSLASMAAGSLLFYAWFFLRRAP
jgi:uncharacterized protein